MVSSANNRTVDYRRGRGSGQELSTLTHVELSPSNTTVCVLPDNQFGLDPSVHLSFDVNTRRVYG